MTEQWIAWEPMVGLSPYHEIDEVLHTDKGLNILLSQADDYDIKIRVIFIEEVEAYRSTYETFRIKISNLYMGRTFFKIENSEYVKWLLEQSQSCPINGDSQFIHFAIATSEAVLDIIAKREPKIEFVNDKREKALGGE